MVPTRLLLLTTLLECLAQLVVQPLLAAGKMRTYGLWQNCSAIFAAFIGWFWIPRGGLSAYLLVRLLYVLIPLLGFGSIVLNNSSSLARFFPLLSLTLFWISLVSLQAWGLAALASNNAVVLATSLLLTAISYRDIKIIIKPLSMYLRSIVKT